jgi:hypothetical protein
VLKWPHYAGAYGFFGGSVAVMIWFSKNKNMVLKIASPVHRRVRRVVDRD